MLLFQLGASVFIAVASPVVEAIEPDVMSISQNEEPSLRVSPVVKAIKNVEAGVVNIQGNKTINTSAPGSNGTGKQEVNGMGTGVIIDPRGYIITNLHVVQDVSRIEVTLADGTVTEARMLNYDPDTDLALIRVDIDRKLPVIPMGTSSDLLRGETVIAIGNPFGYQHTVTVGIVSALHRNIPVNGSQEYKDLIQTNADINPGNSGGPLVNVDGKVIGINVAVRVGAQGIGFAIPIDSAIEVMADLVAASLRDDLTHGLALHTTRGANGAEIRVDEVIKAVATDGAEQVKAGDVLVSMGGFPVRNRLDTELCLLGHQQGDEIDVQLRRSGENHHTRLVLKGLATSSEERLIREAWEKLGIRLSPVPKHALQSAAEKYNGGLKVAEVRPGSAAAREKIVPGDIIVGILNWQTPSLAALSWVLKSEEFANTPTAKFYVVRNNQTFWFAMKVSDLKSR